MKSRELFMLIDQIDRRFVEEAWEGSEDSGKAVEIVLERSSFHAVKYIAAVAACIVLFGVGFFTIANIRMNDPFRPNDSEISSENSGSASSSYTSSESSDTGSESESSDIESVEPIDEFDKLGKYALDCTLASGRSTVGEIVTKMDNYEYAVIYVDETNASEDDPIIVTILSVNEHGQISDAISESLYITGRGKYGFYYTELRGAGAPCVLLLERKGTLDNEESDFLRIIGTWVP